jgi:hypothetical protein
MKKLNLLIACTITLSLLTFCACQYEVIAPDTQTANTITPASATNREPVKDFGNSYYVEDIDTDCGPFQIMILCDHNKPSYLGALIKSLGDSGPVSFSIYRGTDTTSPPLATSNGAQSMSERDVFGGSTNVKIDEITVVIECVGSDPIIRTFKNPCF